MMQNEKAGRGGNPIRPDIKLHDTKKIASERREINEIRDYASEKFRRLKMTAGQRYNELARLINYRFVHGLDIGPVTGWALVLGNLVECFGTTADCFSVDRLRRRLRLPAIDADVVSACCYPAEGRLMPQATVGALLEVTACERQDCRLLRIEACDEPKADRKRRLARLRQQRRRSVTRTLKDSKTERDTRRRVASPALRAFRSSSSIRLPSRHEPQRLSFPSGEKVRGAQRQASEITDRTYAPQARIGISQAPVCLCFDRSDPSSRSYDAQPPIQRRSHTDD